MKYLLDTCTISDFVKGQPNVMAKLKATPAKQVGVSSLTRMEVAFGLSRHSERERKLAPVLDALFGAIVTVPFEEADALAAAGIRAGLVKPLGAYDLLIAGTALARGLVLITSNVAELQRVGGLQVEDWR
jgi:tRNA(fMet)-specific endonuclease VapC